MEFKVGDKVKAFGVNGVVTKVHSSLNELYPVEVDFRDPNRLSFTLDGKYLDWHKTPSLKLRKFKKRVATQPPREIWVNGYSGDESTEGYYGYSYENKDKASVCHRNRIGDKAWRYVLAKKQD